MPGFTIVPTTALISDVLLDAIRNPDRRYVLSTPPSSGKSLLASVIAPVFALMLDNDARVIVKSYGDTVGVGAFSGQARRLVAEHAGLLGFEVDQSQDRGGPLAGRRTPGRCAQRRNLVRAQRVSACQRRSAGGRRPD